MNEVIDGMEDPESHHMEIGIYIYKVELIILTFPPSFNYNFFNSSLLIILLLEEITSNAATIVIDWRLMMFLLNTSYSNILL